jgi:Kef-type K+ transport system membrane component KefB
MGNLLLRVGFALSIVLAAIGMTLAAPNSFVQSEGATAVPTASVTPVVAGYQAAPLTVDRAAAPSASTQQAQQAATLVALATTIVLLAIFVILFSYRPRPGGVRASHR